MDEQKLREQFIQSELDDCRHFNGIQHKICKAGVSYPAGSPGTAMPCIPRLANGRPVWACEKFEIMSRDEAEKEADERIAAMRRTMNARLAAKDDAKAKGFGRGHGGVSSIPCPVCDGGILHYSVAYVNGHMHAACSTQGCVSWME